MNLISLIVIGLFGASISIDFIFPFFFQFPISSRLLLHLFLSFACFRFILLFFEGESLDD